MNHDMTVQQTIITKSIDDRSCKALDVFSSREAQPHETFLCVILECISIASLVMRLVLWIREVRDQIISFFDTPEHSCDIGESYGNITERLINKAVSSMKHYGLNLCHAEIMMLLHALVQHLRLAISRTPSHAEALHGASRNILFCTYII